MITAGRPFHNRTATAGQRTTDRRRPQNAIMSKHLNPLEKEFLIRQYKNNPTVKMNDFCRANDITSSSLRKWIKQYEEGGIEGLARADAEIKQILPEGVDPSVEAYKKEILKLRIENERLKKNYTVQTNEAGVQEYVRLKPKNSK